ncbi:MAG TPA: hypothetical protein ENH10_01545 [Bacteroidetes bacterium]|nr:hypothetical protein [Bacteroidota bacterium]HEX03830.1 hypothetical protein [Bacteroidota bacterium]
MMLIASCFIPSIGIGLLVGYLFEARGDEILLYLVGGFIMGIIIAVLVVRHRMISEENDVSAITRNRDLKTTGYRFRSDHHRIRMVNRLVFIGIPLVVLLFWGGHHLATRDRTSAIYTPAVQVSTPRLIRVQVDKDGFTETKRREIFRSIVRAEDRAFAAAERKYPLPNPRSAGYTEVGARAQLARQAQTAHTLAETYKKGVANRYGIDMGKIGSIISEGIHEDWALPKP